MWTRSDDDSEIYLMRGVAPPPVHLVPSISPAGLALLAGLVLGLVARARTPQRPACSWR